MTPAASAEAAGVILSALYGTGAPAHRELEARRYEVQLPQRKQLLRIGRAPPDAVNEARTHFESETADPSAVALSWQFPIGIIACPGML